MASKKLLPLVDPGKSDYQEFCARSEARRSGMTAITELKRIVESRENWYASIDTLTEAINDLTSQLRRKKIDAISLIEKLERVVNRLSEPASDSDVIKAADILLNRGWGRPKIESNHWGQYMGMDDVEAREVVRASLIARAVDGDVAAQQAVLKLPSRVEILGIGDGNFDTSNLTEEDMAVFMSLIQKMNSNNHEDGEND